MEMEGVGVSRFGLSICRLRFLRNGFNAPFALHPASKEVQAKFAVIDWLAIFEADQIWLTIERVRSSPPFPASCANIELKPQWVHAFLSFSAQIAQGRPDFVFPVPTS